MIQLQLLIAQAACCAVGFMVRESNKASEQIQNIKAFNIV